MGTSMQPGTIGTKRWANDPSYLTRFCSAYLESFSIMEAALATDTPYSTATRYMHDPDVCAELKRLTREAMYNSEVTVHRILRELANGAFLDIALLMDEQGVIQCNVHDIPEAARRTITEITQKTIGDVILETKVKCMSKEKTLELIGKYREIAMFKEVVETNTTDEVARVRTASLEDRVAGLEKDRAASMRKE